MKTALIGFHRLKKKHSGINIAKNILHLLDRADVTFKVYISYYIYHMFAILFCRLATLHLTMPRTML